MKNSITIEGQTVELPQELIDQIKGVIDEAKKPKLPTWDEVFKGGKYSVTWKGKLDCEWDYGMPENRLLSERSAMKAATFHKLLAVADYLNEGWMPDWNNFGEHKWEIYYNSKLKLFRIEKYTYISSAGICFKSEQLAQRAIETFKANGDEQELIDFYTK
jgi:hypothetical protein